MLVSGKRKRGATVSAPSNQRHTLGARLVAPASVPINTAQVADKMKEEKGNQGPVMEKHQRRRNLHRACADRPPETVVMMRQCEDNNRHHNRSRGAVPCSGKCNHAHGNPKLFRKCANGEDKRPKQQRSSLHFPCEMILRVDRHSGEHQALCHDSQRPCGNANR